MRRQSTAETRHKALDLWVAPAGAGEPLVCVASTFTFDATFFETECLGRFLQMDTHPSESESVAYLIEREEKLAAAKVCALVDRRHARDKESLRWDVLGVIVPRAIQHAKLALLVWGNHVRVIIGSGNLTEAGYRKNLEVFGTIEFSKVGGGDRSGVDASIDFLEEIARFAIGNDKGETAKSRLRLALTTVRRQIARWPSNVAGKRDAVPVFGSPKHGVLRQVTAKWPSSSPPRVASIVSPFFDRPGRDVDAIDLLVGSMAKRGFREVSFSVRSEDLPSGQRRIFAPRGMVEAAMETCDVSVHTVSGVQRGEVRDLHAKIILLKNDEWFALLVGSSNFTAAGIGANPKFGNLEANLLYVMKATDRKGMGALDSVWPEVSAEPLDVTDPKLIWDPEPEELEDGAELVPLPACFHDAVFSAGDLARLIITLTTGLPTWWRICEPNGRDLLSSDAGDGIGEHEIKWPEPRPPFVLEVSWHHGSEVAVANWPVNVANPAALPPPEALGGLSLEELLAILSSTRPLHEAVVHVLERRSNGRRIGVELDPLKRLDSPSMLLRRTKRVAVALERLRERLERPALTRDAYEWRLRGPIGPMRLAEAFVREAPLPGESKFYLAELALALSRVRPSLPASGGLRLKTVTQLIAAAVQELEDCAASLPPTSDAVVLDTYVTAAFDEATKA